METTAIRRRDSEEDTTPAGELRLTRRADGRLWATRGDTERDVWVRRCFPWSEPARFVSLRDDDQQEFALVRDPADLDAASRRVLEEGLVAAGFGFSITRGGRAAGGGRSRRKGIFATAGSRRLAAPAAAGWSADPRRGGGSLSSPRSGCAGPGEAGAGVGVRGLGRTAGPSLARVPLLVLTPLIPSPFGRGETQPDLRSPSPEGRGGQGVRTTKRGTGGE